MDISKFDIADYLDSNEMIAEYLNVVLEEGDDSEIVVAIGNIAKAIGMTKIAEETGLSRPSLYKALAEGSKPQFSTIVKILKAVGGQIRVNPIVTPTIIITPSQNPVCIYTNIIYSPPV